MKHAPRPWSLHGPSRPTADTPEGGDYAILDSDNKIIAEVFEKVGVEQRRPAQANARLITAAPELLEACKAVVEFLSDSDRLIWNTKLECWTIKDGLADPLFLACEGAIAKAEGRES